MRIIPIKGEYRIRRIFTLDGLQFIFVDDVHVITIGQRDPSHILGREEEGEIEIECSTEGLYTQLDDGSIYLYTGNLKEDWEFGPIELKLFDRRFLTNIIPTWEEFQEIKYRD